MNSRCRGQLKCDGTCAETRYRLSPKRTSPFQSEGRQFSRLLAVEVCASVVVMLDTPCSEVAWRVLGTHSIRQFPLHFPSRASPCAITYQLESTQNCLERHVNYTAYSSSSSSSSSSGSSSSSSSGSSRIRRASGSITVPLCPLAILKWELKYNAKPAIGYEAY